MENNLTVTQFAVQKYQEVREASLRLCAPLEKEDFVVQPVVDVSPPKWHLAHTTWFFETFLLLPFLKDYRLFDPQYPLLFNSYYVAAGPRWKRASRGNLTRPSVDDIFRYRNHVDRHMMLLLGGSAISDEFATILELGLNHEQQHQELLYYDIKYIFGHNPVFPVYKESNVHINKFKQLGWLSVPSGNYEVGFSGKGFHFDNEEAGHTVYLHGFEIADRLISNGEYLEFIQAGGYQNPSFWLSEGWDWVQQNQVTAPLYWIHEEDGWFYYTLSGYKPVDPDRPVMHMSYFEADAFARWHGCRLPTEQEWEVVASRLEPIIPKEAHFTDNQVHEPYYTGGYDFHGSLWEWTASAYLPYPFYKVPPGALGEYNGKFMINQMVLRGGSYATARDHIRTTYRNFFHPHLRWMFSGIRLAKHSTH